MIDFHWEIVKLANSFDRIAVNRFYKISVFVTFVVLIACSLNFFLFKGKSKYPGLVRLLGSEYTYTITTFVFLFLARWPGFLPPYLNPDEKQFTAGAMKLLQDPIFWRSVDGNTTGPLNIYAVTIPAFFGFNLDSATSRLIGLILVFIAVLGLYYSLRCLYHRDIARLSLIPVITTFAFMREADYIHYSSEHLSVAILSVALALVCHGYTSGFRYTSITLLGFLLGLIPFAKLQGLPIAFVITLFFANVLWIKHDRKPVVFRELLAFCLAFIIPSILGFLILILSSSFDDFWKSYVIQNLVYTNSSNFLKRAELSLWQKLFIVFPRWWMRMQDTRYLFVLFQVFLLSIAVLIVKYKVNKISYWKIFRSDTALLIGYSLLIVFASIFAAAKPGTFFGHYLFFLIIPCGFSIGVIAGEIEKSLQNFSTSRREKLLINMVLIALLVGGSTTVAFSRLRSNPFIWNQKTFLDNFLHPVSLSILKYGSPGDSMVVWGWAPELYVDTKLVQGTRDSINLWQIEPSALQPYYLQRFVTDLNNSKAKIFVDAVSPSMFGFRDRSKQGHEAFPDVERVVRENYQFVEEVNGVRIYTRK